MPNLLNIDTTKPTYISADTENQIRISNVTNTTLYYDDVKTVSDSSNDGNLTQGQNASFSTGVYLLPAANCQVIIQYLRGEEIVDQLNLASGTSATNKGIVQGDVNWYRSAANNWTTDDGVIIAHADGLELSADGGKDTLVLSNTTADVGITWGTDVNLYRPSANLLETDDGLKIGLTLEVTGASTPTGGVVNVNPGDEFWGEAPGLDATGATSTVPGADEMVHKVIKIDYNSDITGVLFLTGDAGGNGNVKAAIHSAADGTVLAETTASVACQASTTWKKIPFASVYSAVGPNYYYISLTFAHASDSVEAITSVVAAGTETNSTFAAETITSPATAAGAAFIGVAY